MTIVADPSSPAGRLAERVALVVGGANGIGRAAAGLFAREGAHVMIGDIDREAASKAAEEIGAARAAWAHVDVTSDESVQALVASCVRRWGGLHVLLVTAGGSLPQDGPATEVDLAVWERTVSVDARGTLLCARHAIPAMIASGGGSVINMSSGAALRGSGRAHVYAAAKGAVNSLTRALAGAYAKRNIRVNAICAGRVETERVRRSYGEGRPDPFDAAAVAAAYPFWIGTPMDIANVALFLACDDSRMITGAEIPANGGRSAY